MRYLISVLIMLACQDSKHITTHQSKIVGKWCLVQRNTINEINYGQIQFDGNEIITLFSRTDTLYSYKYKLQNKVLLIIRSANNDTIRNPILKLTSDSLIFSSLIEKTSLQTYHRCDN
jgi:hypothetical protein